MLNSANLLQAAGRAVEWMTRETLPEPEGRWGIYERIRIDLNSRTWWVRPDCTTESALALVRYNDLSGGGKEPRGRYRKIGENMVIWVLGQQVLDAASDLCGSFPFYTFMPPVPAPDREQAAGTRFMNDNGKVAFHLFELASRLENPTLSERACHTLDWLVRMQRSDGTFGTPGPCFVEWPALALLRGYKETGRPQYREAARKAVQWLMNLQLQNGRLQTTYELGKVQARPTAEDWRPVSSETVIFLRTLAIATLALETDEYRRSLRAAADWVIHHQHPSGGILNGDDESRGASLQEPYLCDLVYTNGFAGEALYDAYEATKDVSHLAAAQRQAAWLIKTQCVGESSDWAGAWRGSYHPETGQWAGRANQNNPIDEGGMYSVYTRWATAPSVLTLLRSLDYVNA